MIQNNTLKIEDFKDIKNLDQVNKIWYSIMKMEVANLNLALGKRITFNGLTKQQFLNKIQEKFQKHKNIGDSEFYLHLVECNKKHFGHIICEFVGVESGINLGLFFKHNNHTIEKIEFCDCLGSIEDLNNYFD